MKKLIIKSDRLILNQLTSYIKKWIEKKEYKEHKFDFQIHLEWIEFFIMLLIGIAIPVMLYIVEGKIIQAILHAAVWLVMVGGSRLFGIYSTKIHLKTWHDQSFSNRKNPIIYQVHKEILEKLFVEKRRERIIRIFLMWGVMISFVFLIFALSFLSHNLFGASSYVCLFLLIDIFFFTVNSYIFYVFDFDEPEQKKKVKESISEVVLRAWNQLIGNLSPAPGY